MLRESEEQYRTTLESMADPLHVVDSDLRIVLMNEAFRTWCRELGIPEDTIGKTVFEVYPFLPPQVQDEYAEVFATGKTLMTDDVVSIGGRRFHTETRKIPVLEGKRVVRVVTTVRDVTEKKLAEQALARYTATAGGTPRHGRGGAGCPFTPGDRGGRAASHSPACRLRAGKRRGL